MTRIPLILCPSMLSGRAQWWRPVLWLVLIATGAGCASTPPPPPVPVVTYEQKLSWIFRLEDQRMLRDPAPPPPAVAPVTPTAPAPVPDLLALVGDRDARIRRRAALAIGRVGLAAGVQPLGATLSDSDPDVRRMAAFALGLLGDKAAETALTAALQDADLMVRGRAAEALGQIGATGAAPAIGELVKTQFQAGNVAAIEPDDLEFPVSAEVEVFRLGLYALARLKSYDAMAAAVLDAQGRPLSRWWPVAYALQRVEDPRAAEALLHLAHGAGSFTVAFAARGLGQLKHAGASDVLLSLLNSSRDRRVRVSAIRALAQLGNTGAAVPLLALAVQPNVEPELRLEAVMALGELRATAAVEALLDLMSDRWPPIRGAAMQAVARTDPETFITVLSGLDPDPHWSVRAALAGALQLLDPEMSALKLQVMLNDSDQRVVPAVLRALAQSKAPAIDKILLTHLTKDDPVVRMTAATLIGERKSPDGIEALRAAYTDRRSDPTYVPRAAALAALAQYRTPDAIATLKTAFTDPDWAVRVRAAALLAEAEPGADYAAAIRPAPGRVQPQDYAAPALLAPPVSPHVYIDTPKGTIQIELAVLEAPFTVQNFVALASKGFFNGMAWHRVVGNFVVQGGDPRSDGEGGPGYTIRDELNELPYLRGTVGMALDWRDTGGSQFFITHSPQPHLDARYTAFGRVVGGLEVVDRLQQWDLVDRVRVWDGTQMTGR